MTIEALGTQDTFETKRYAHSDQVAHFQALESTPGSCRYRMTRSGQASVTTVSSRLYALGKERMRRLMEVVRHKRVDLTPLLTHRFSLDDIREGYRVFGERLDGVLKVAIKP